MEFNSAFKVLIMFFDMMDLVYSHVMCILYITWLYAFLILAVFSPSAAQLSLPVEGLLIIHSLMMSVISNMTFYIRAF